jgi:tetratricopeptide (TPR) repeat protein
MVMAFIGLLASLQVYAQNIYKSDQEPGYGGSSINIAVSKFDLTEGNNYYEDAEDLEHKGDFNEALALFGKAAFEYNAIKNFNLYGQALIKMSNMHYQLGRFTDAEQILLNVALKNYSKIGSKSGLMNTYNLLGKVYLAGNKYTQSMWFYTQQGILAKQLKSNNSYIESMLGIVHVKIRKKDFSLASKDLKQVELLSNSIKSTQYRSQIKDAREMIAGKSASKSKS